MATKIPLKSVRGIATVFEAGDTVDPAHLPAPGGVSDGDKGDITVSGAGTVWTVDNDVVTYAKIQNVSATSRILGRITAAAGDIEELTGTQATTLLDAFTDVLKGLVPLSGGGTTNFLRADGTWAAAGGASGDLDFIVSSVSIIAANKVRTIGGRYFIDNRLTLDGRLVLV